MAISKIKIGTVEHELQTTIANVENLQTTLDEINNKLDYTNIAYGTCSTAAATADKVITISGNTQWELKAGSTIIVKFSATNTASNPTFNVNGTGAKSVWYGTAVITTSSLSYAGYKNRPMIFTYDGTQYVFMGWSYDANSDTKVTQAAAITTSGEYPVMLGYSTSTSSVTNTLNKTSTLKYNPSTQVLTAPTFKGDLDGTANRADSIGKFTSTDIENLQNELATKAPLQVKEASGTQIEITDGADAPFVGLKVYGNESPSTNLLMYPRDYSYLIYENLGGSTSGYYNGLHVTVNNDGSITVNGTATSNVDFFLPVETYGLIDWNESPEGQSWTIVFDIGLSDESARDNVVNFYSKYTQELKTPVHLTFEDLVNINGGADNDEFCFSLKAGATFNNLTIYPQINKDSLKPWQPCGQQILTNKPITVTMSNGTETKDVVIPIDALYGYGVYESEDSSDSGARDYIDFERKKLVKYYNHEYVLTSVESIVEGAIFNAGFDYGEAESNGVNIQQCVLTNNPMYKRAEHPDSIWGTPNGVQYLNMWADQYFWIQNTDWEYKSLSEINAELAANPLVFVFPTTEPIEYDLTDEQIEAFEQMKTYLGNTTISTDCGTIMDVEYYGDGKADKVHTHEIADVTNLQSELNSRAKTSDLTSGATKVNKTIKLVSEDDIRGLAYTAEDIEQIMTDIDENEMHIGQIIEGAITVAHAAQAERIGQFYAADIEGLMEKANRQLTAMDILNEEVGEPVGITLMVHGEQLSSHESQLVECATKSDLLTLENTVNNKANKSHTHDSSVLQGGFMDKPGYINTHPEYGQGIIPFIYNDLAFVHKRGGSYRYYNTTDTDFTVNTLNETSVTISEDWKMFDGTPSYAYVRNCETITNLVIDITLPYVFQYNNQFYIDFGSPNWRAQNISLYVKNSNTESAYVLKGNKTNNQTNGWHKMAVSHSSTDSEGATIQGFNKMRIVLSGFGNLRIAQIGLIKFNSDGVANTYISRNGCDGLFGNIIPYTSNAIDLGSSSKKFKNMYTNNMQIGDANLTFDSTNKRLVISFNG